MGATDEEKAEATAEVDDEFAGRQQQMETAIIQVNDGELASVLLCTVCRFGFFFLCKYWRSGE